MGFPVQQMHLCWPTWTSTQYKFLFYVRPWPYQEGTTKKVKLSSLGRIQVQLVEKHCIGRLEGGSHVPCPQVSNTNVMRCQTCRSNDLTSSCAACRGETCLNPKAKHSYCSNPFVCYLAGFLPNLIKVGVAIKSRFLERVFEQGADFATILDVKQNGKRAKRLEHSIAQMNISDRLRKQRKRKALYTGVLQRLSSKFYTYRQKIGEKFSLKDHPVLELYKKAGYPHLKRKPLSISLKKGKRISGEIIGVKGSWIVFQERTSVYALNSWNLAGWVVKKIDTKMKTQSLLFQ